MNNLFKNKLAFIILCGIVSISVGVMAGFVAKNNYISQLQGYLYNGIRDNATNSNVWINATNTNVATNSNVWINATTTNVATNSNAYQENYLYLNAFSFEKNYANAGEKLNVTLDTSGARLSGASVVLKNSKSDILTTLKIYSVNNNPYIEIPSGFETENYVINDLLLTGMNSSGRTFSVHYTNSADLNNLSFDSRLWNFPNNLYINGNTEKNIKLNSFKILQNSGNTGEDVKVETSLSGDVQTMMLTFISNSGKKMTGYVKAIETNPYFKIPSLVEPGRYKLSSITLYLSGMSVVYSLNPNDGEEKLEYSIELEVINNSTNEMVLNNEDINNLIIQKIKSIDDDGKIIINADAKSIIDKEVFNSIKGTGKNLIINYGENQIIFNGKNITDAKTIDVSIEIKKVSDNNDISNLIGHGIILVFADNGTLPGVENVRIKSSSIVKKVLIDKNIYVYMFNEDTRDFTLIKENVAKNSDDYYEFEVDHNSIYVLVPSPLDESLVVRKPVIDTVIFQKSNNVHYLLIGIGVILILVLLITIIVLRYRKKYNSSLYNTKTKDIKQDNIENNKKIN